MIDLRIFILEPAMRNLCFLLTGLMSLCGTASADGGVPMMAWPQLVQVDWDAYHGKMIENCNVKFPESAKSFKEAIQKWNDHNAAAILEVRRQVRERIKNAKGLSESEAKKEVNLKSKVWTDIFLKQVADTPENEWKDICSGKYAAETLSALDFAKYLPNITAAIPTLREDYLLPRN